MLSMSPERMRGSYERSRARIHRRGWAVVKASPLIGTAGTENNRTSIYLNLAVDNGVISAACIMVLIGWVMARNVRLSARLSDPFLSAVTVGCAVGMIGLLVTGIGLGGAVRRMFVPQLWYLIALGPAIVAGCGPKTETGDELHRAKQVNRRAILLLIVAGLVAGGIILAAEHWAG
jgi:hypothetical protein